MNKFVKMGGEIQLKCDTKLKLNEEHYSVTKVAEIVDESRKMMVNLLKDPNNYGERKSCGRSVSNRSG